MAQNPLDHINRIPDEMIAQIMELYTYEDDLQDLIRTPEPSSPSLSANTKQNSIPHVNKPDQISSVCRRWRYIALNTPRLWAQFHLSWPASVVSTYMVRSGSAPLALGIDGVSFRQELLAGESDNGTATATNAERIIQSLSESNSCHRICRLSIQSLRHPIPRSFLSFATSIFSSDLPVTTPNMSQLHFESMELAPGAHPLIISLAHLPRLSDIKFLKNISLRSTFPSPCLLSHVHADCEEISSTHLVQFLKSCPLLEDVVLVQKDVNDYPSAEVEEDHPTDESDVTSDHNCQGLPNQSPPSNLPFPLPHLKNLTLRWTDTSYAEAVLSNFLFPPSASISLAIKRSEDQSVVSALPAPLLTFLTHSHTLSITVEPLRWWPISFSLDFKSSLYPRISVEFNEYLRMPGHSLGHSTEDEKQWMIEDTDAIFDSLTHRVPLNQLKELEISARCLHSVDAGILSTFLANISLVERLSVGTIDADIILTAISSGPHNTVDKTIRHPLPKLHFLDLQNSRFSLDLLESVLLDREDWAAEMSGIKFMRDKSLDMWSDDDGRTAEDVLTNLKWYGTEIEGGNWTESSVDSEEEDY
ncbi:hypothetical protein SISNIDRAFT_465236 [Sistotremastrum niveocremeum HHB9708]|uniref:Uncharacterized protein n=1 Tax=Sistotremastrum niveocremeum HHB9708 TaxID=1314777 RepID=A0A164WFH4_9AGAM|nr:hypothetical protein SISNIDRAFT_465236 [Sistotremastrum niveocremeum HHB9708]